MARYERLEEWIEKRYPSVKTDHLTKDELQDTLITFMEEERVRGANVSGWETINEKGKFFRDGGGGWDWLENAIKDWRIEKIKEVDATRNFTQLKRVKEEIEKEEIDSKFENLKDSTLDEAEERKGELVQSLVEARAEAQEISRQRRREFALTEITRENIWIIAGFRKVSTFARFYGLGESEAIDRLEELGLGVEDNKIIR